MNMNSKRVKTQIFRHPHPLETIIEATKRELSNNMKRNVEKL